MLNFENSLIFQIEQFRIFVKWVISQYKSFGNFLNYTFLELHFFLIWKIIKLPEIKKFWNCSPIRYSARFAILPIVILPFDINSIFYSSDSSKFDRSIFARLLIFKFEISAILKIYCSKFWAWPIFNTSGSIHYSRWISLLASSLCVK